MYAWMDMCMHVCVCVCAYKQRTPYLRLLISLFSGSSLSHLSCVVSGCHWGLRAGAALNRSGSHCHQGRVAKPKANKMCPVAPASQGPMRHGVVVGYYTPYTNRTVDIEFP